MDEIFFEGDGERLAATVFPAAGAPCSVVLLHGAGTATKARVTALAADVAASGRGAVAFDFSGHGASTGSIPELSLERRYQQACAAIDTFCDNITPLTLICFSMSGQTGGDLLGRYGQRIAVLGLCSPAVYPKAAWHVPFTERFTAQIRVPGRWADSGALENYRQFTGRAVLATPQRDAVIPPEVTETLVGALSQSAMFVRLIFEGADHRLGSWLSKRPVQRAQLIDALFATEGGRP